MQKKDRLSLQPSEAHVFRAAANIYSAYVSAGKVPDGAEAEWLDKALSMSLHLAQRTDARIQSDDEISGGLGGGKGLSPGGGSGPKLGLR